MLAYVGKVVALHRVQIGRGGTHIRRRGHARITEVAGDVILNGYAPFAFGSYIKEVFVRALAGRLAFASRWLVLRVLVCDYVDRVPVVIVSDGLGLYVSFAVGAVHIVVNDSLAT